MLENTEGAIKNEQSRETGNIWYTRLRQTKQKHNTICVGHHNTQPNMKVLSTEKRLYEGWDYLWLCILVPSQE